MSGQCEVTLLNLVQMSGLFATHPQFLNLLYPLSNFTLNRRGESTHNPLVSGEGGTGSAVPVPGQESVPISDKHLPLSNWQQLLLSPIFVHSFLLNPLFSQAIGFFS